MVALLDPNKSLPRDSTGRYLHLKLKRFPSIDALSMANAKKTWREVPHDAEVDIAPSSRSSCRQCREKIVKGDIRMRLWLQCHKGCKVGAYFHGTMSCFFEYPETAKLSGAEELVGLKKIPDSTRKIVEKCFDSLIKEADVGEEPKKKKRKIVKS